MKKPFKIPLIVAATVVALIAITCTRHRGNDHPQSVRIGALLPLTGSGANYGTSLRNGLELAREKINARGGINGKPLEIAYEDSQGDAKTGITAFNKLVDVDHVPVVVGSISSVILAVTPVADQKRVVLINSSAISPRIPEQAVDFLFSIMVSGAQEADFMASDYVRHHAGEPIAVVFSNNSSGIDTKDTFVRRLQGLGGTVALEEGYELNTTDFRTLLAKVRASAVKFAYLIAFSSDEFAHILNQSRELRLDVQWYSYSGIETRETLDLAGASAEGVRYSYPDYSAHRQVMEDFQRTYQDRYGSWPDIYTATSYDGLNMLATVLSHYGVTSLEIQRGLRATGSYSGVFGDLRFADKQYVTQSLIWKTVSGGKYVLAAQASATRAR